MLAVLIAAALMAVAPNDVPIETGYGLLQRCEHGRDANHPLKGPEAAFCSAFLNGAWNGAIATETAAGIAPLFCAPPTQVGQMVSIYMDWAKRNPAALSANAGAVALTAFRDTFPCRPKP